MGKRKELSEFDEVQNCRDDSAVVQGRNSGKPAIWPRWPRVTDACGERRLSCVVQVNRRITVGQIANRFSVSSDGKVDACPDPVLSLKMPTMGV